jgi:hypothetical protein
MFTVISKLNLFQNEQKQKAHGCWFMCYLSETLTTKDTKKRSSISVKMGYVWQ